MAEEGEFKIKGAAHRVDRPARPSEPSTEKLDEPENPPIATEADEAEEGKDTGSRVSRDGKGKQTAVAEEVDGSNESNNEESKQAADERMYRWYRCEVDDPALHQGKLHYYIHADTYQSVWEKPSEPYWIWNAASGKADEIGLQFPDQETRTREDVLKLDPKATAAATAGGYNPKIHGNYDPNADYAKVDKQKWREEEAASKTWNTGLAPQMGVALFPPDAEAGRYASIVATNRFSGGVQSDGVGPERHSDAAKSHRQMNAYFDVDAAANAHDGRSLKEERKAQKLTKDQVKAYNQARHEKKQKKRLAFYKS